MKKFLIGIIGMLFIVAAPITGIAHNFGASDALASALGLVSIPITMYLVKKFPSQKMPGVYLNGVEVEVWSDYIASNLFKGWSFIKRSFDASSYVLVGKVVHIPNAGSKPTVVKNRSSLPAVAIKRTDTDVLYALDEYTTDPVVIEDAANVQLSYDKMDDVLGDHNGALNEAVCDNMLIAWAPSVATNITRSTGTLAAGNTYLTGATNSRRAYTLYDLKTIRKKMNIAKVPKDGRVCLMTEDAWAQIEDELRISNSRDFSAYLDAREGTLSNAKGDSIGRLYGFDIYTTPNTVVYDNGNTASTWTRSTTTATITAPAAHGLTTGNNVFISTTSDAAAIPLGIYAVTVTGSTTYTITCLNAGAASGTLTYSYNSLPVLKAYGALGATTDNDAILCYQERMVEAAIGEIKFFGQEQNPLYYGDVYSALVRAGGRKRYNTEAGVYAIVQAAV